MKEESKEPLTSIPWQLCPKCNGDGNLARYNSPSIISTDASLMCDVCNGAKVILQFVPQAAPVSTNTGLKEEKDMMGERCNCGGYFKEEYQLDDLKGVLHCSNCLKEIKRYRTIQSPSVSEGEDKANQGTANNLI